MMYLSHLSAAIGAIGVVVIVLGVAGGLSQFLRVEWTAVHGAAVQMERRQLRQTLGYFLLLGLEFLIAADVIETLLKPDAKELLALGVIVAIRTAISYSLNRELARDECPSST